MTSITPFKLLRFSNFYLLSTFQLLKTSKDDDHLITNDFYDHYDYYDYYDHLITNDYFENENNDDAAGHRGSLASRDNAAVL